MNFNLDIFETGIINLILTIISVALFIKSELPGELTTHSDNITKPIENAETKLREAKQRLKEVTNQYNQIIIVACFLKISSIFKKRKLLSTELAGTELELESEFERAFKVYFSKERSVFLEVKKKVTLLVLEQLIKRTKKTFDDPLKTLLFNKNIINNLEKGEWI